MTHHHHDNEGRMLQAFLLTAAVMVVEVVGGWYAGSLALLADAGHMLTDALSLLLAWGAFRLARRKPDAERSYGYKRAEILAALVNGLTVLALAGWIVIEAFGRIAEPRPVLAGPMIAVAAVGLLANILVLKLLHGGHANLNTRGAALHVLGDLLGSVAALGAGATILVTGWTIADPLLSVVVAGLMVLSALRLVGESAHILMEGTPKGLDMEEMRRVLTACPGVENIHHVHAWSLTAEAQLLTLHAHVKADCDGQKVLAAIKTLLEERFNIDHSVVQLEFGTCPDEEQCRRG